MGDIGNDDHQYEQCGVLAVIEDSGNLNPDFTEETHHVLQQSPWAKPTTCEPSAQETDDCEETEEVERKAVVCSKVLHHTYWAAHQCRRAGMAIKTGDAALLQRTIVNLLGFKNLEVGIEE